MRVFIILAVTALAHGAKLERTYLPPSNARSSGGSGNILQTPISGPSTYSQNGNGFYQRGAGFSQSGAGFSQTGAGFSQNGPESSQAFGGNEFNNINGFNSLESRPERPQAGLERSAAILRQDNSNDGESFAYAFETENGIYAEESGVATNGVEAQGGYSYTGDDGQVYSIRYTADQNGFMPQGDHIPTPPPVPEAILKALEQNARDEAAGIFDDGLYNEAKYSNNNGIQQYQQNYNGNDDAVVTDAAFSRNYPTDADTPRTGTTGFGRTSGVQKAYLPPISADSPRGLTSAITGPSSSFGNRGFSGRSSGIETAYIPPSAADLSRNSAGSTFGTRGSISSSFVPQGSNGPAFGTRGSANPTFATQGSNGPTFGTRGLSGPSFGVQKEYLPPFATRTGNGLRRQQSFDSKNGYNY